MSSESQLGQQFGSKPGSYDLLIRVSNPILNPGDKVQFEVYLSGYGIIQAAAVFIAPSWSIFSREDSRVAISDLPPDPWDRLGVVVSLNPASFSDAKGSYQISTECNSPPPSYKPPISMDMAILPDAPPGTHSVHFILKYYNGETWNTKSTSVNFTVRNFYQRHETFVWSIGGVAAFLSIISIVYPFLKWLYCWVEQKH